MVEKQMMYTWELFSSVPLSAEHQDSLVLSHFISGPEATSMAATLVLGLDARLKQPLDLRLGLG